MWVKVWEQEQVYSYEEHQDAFASTMEVVQDHGILSELVNVDIVSVQATSHWGGMRELCADVNARAK